MNPPIFVAFATIATTLIMSCTPIQTSGVNIRILTWNVLWSNQDHQAITTLLLDSQADIVCLQEVTPTHEQSLLTALSDAYPHTFFESQDNSGHGCAILSRLPFQQTQLLDNPYAGPPALWAQIQTPQGPVQVLNIHLTSPALLSGSLFDRTNSYFKTTGVRLHEITHFAQSLEPSIPALVAGDFNSFENEPAIKYLETEFHLTDVYRTLNRTPSPADITWHRDGQPDALMKARIDYIFASHQCKPLTARVIPTASSDHRPVLAILSICPQE